MSGDWTEHGRQHSAPHGDASAGAHPDPVVVSATMYFPDQARAIMGAFAGENQPASEWETMRGGISMVTRRLWRYGNSAAR